ncbi:MAG: MOSC domain-containing protein [Alphaproteobacteria bacterium]|nr:MOSC domain-containing protein [Alphaproteobacteria bacterium]
MIRIREIHSYPVKGLNGRRLERARLVPGQGLPWDRAFAIAHGTAPFDAEAPQWLPKTHFLMLMQNERLAQLDCRFDDETQTLSVLRDGRQVARGRLGDQIGRAVIEQFFAAYLRDEVRGAPRIVSAEGHRFHDSRSGFLSIVGLASVSDLERVVRRTVNPLRFRANIYLEGSLPWEEFNWVGREINIGEARLRIVKRIERCPATDVDPLSGARDMHIPLALRSGFGHQDLGVYAEVIGDGEIASGDELRVPPV